MCFKLLVWQGSCCPSVSALWESIVPTRQINRCGSGVGLVSVRHLPYFTSGLVTAASDGAWKWQAGKHPAAVHCLQSHSAPCAAATQDWWGSNSGAELPNRWCLSGCIPTPYLSLLEQREGWGNCLGVVVLYLDVIFHIARVTPNYIYKFVCTHTHMYV